MRFVLVSSDITAEWVVWIWTNGLIYGRSRMCVCAQWMNEPTIAWMNFLKLEKEIKMRLWMSSVSVRLLWNWKLVEMRIHMYGKCHWNDDGISCSFTMAIGTRAREFECECEVLKRDNAWNEYWISQPYKPYHIISLHTNETQTLPFFIISHIWRCWMNGMSYECQSVLCIFSYRISSTNLFSSIQPFLHSISYHNILYIIASESAIPEIFSAVPLTPYNVFE